MYLSLELVCLVAWILNSIVSIASPHPLQFFKLSSYFSLSGRDDTSSLTTLSNLHASTKNVVYYKRGIVASKNSPDAAGKNYGDASGQSTFDYFQNYNYSGNSSGHNMKPQADSSANFPKTGKNYRNSTSSSDSDKNTSMVKNLASASHPKSLPVNVPVSSYSTIRSNPGINYDTDFSSSSSSISPPSYTHQQLNSSGTFHQHSFLNKSNSSSAKPLTRQKTVYNNLSSHGRGYPTASRTKPLVNAPRPVTNIPTPGPSKHRNRDEDIRKFHQLQRDFNEELKKYSYLFNKELFTPLVSGPTTSSPFYMTVDLGNHAAENSLFEGFNGAWVFPDYTKKRLIVINKSHPAWPNFSSMFFHGYQNQEVFYLKDSIMYNINGYEKFRVYVSQTTGELIVEQKPFGLLNQIKDVKSCHDYHEIMKADPKNPATNRAQENLRKHTPGFTLQPLLQNPSNQRYLYLNWRGDSTFELCYDVDIYTAYIRIIQPTTHSGRRTPVHRCAPIRIVKNDLVKPRLKGNPGYGDLKTGSLVRPLGCDNHDPDCHQFIYY